MSKRANPASDDAIDQLDRAADLLHAAYIVANDLTVEHAGPMRAVIGAAMEELGDAIEALEKERQPGSAGRAVSRLREGAS